MATMIDPIRNPLTEIPQNGGRSPAIDASTALAADGIRPLFTNRAVAGNGFLSEMYQILPRYVHQPPLTENLIAFFLKPISLSYRPECGKRLQADFGIGDFIIVPALHPAEWHYTTSLEVMHLRISSASLARVVSQEWGSQSRQLNGFRALSDLQVTRLGLILKAEIEGGNPNGRLFCEGLSSALAIHLLQRHGVHRHVFHVPSEALVRTELRQAIEFIHDHLSDDIGLEEIASVACLSVAHFSQLFKQHTGISVHQYVLRARLEKARLLLRQTDKTLSEVATSVGFFDESHLIRHFKRHLGATPNRYRQECRL